jgi:hypothetical protein
MSAVACLLFIRKSPETDTHALAGLRRRQSDGP